MSPIHNVIQWNMIHRGILSEPAIAAMCPLSKITQSSHVVFHTALTPDLQYHLGIPWFLNITPVYLAIKQWSLNG